MLWGHFALLRQEWMHTASLKQTGALTEEAIETEGETMSLANVIFIALVFNIRGEINNEYSFKWIRVVL